MVHVSLLKVVAAYAAGKLASGGAEGIQNALACSLAENLVAPMWAAGSAELAIVSGVWAPRISGTRTVRERQFALLGQPAVERQTFHGVPDLKRKTMADCDDYSESAEPVGWVAAADSTCEQLDHSCKPLNGTVLS